MRIVSWNMRRATRKRTGAWDYFAELSPDLGFLQEVNSIPESIEANYEVLYRKAKSKNGRPQQFGTAILAKNAVMEEQCYSTEWAWVNNELDNFSGYFVAALVRFRDGMTVNVMSVHSPAWPVDKQRLQDINVDGIKLTHSADVWGTELLWAILRSQDVLSSDWIVAGDFNSSESFDHMWPGGPHGNREFLDRMTALGFREALRECQGQLTPTFRNACGGGILHQIDHVFVGERLFQVLRDSQVGCHDRVFGQSLSDHVPVVADFDTGKLVAQ